MQIRKLIIMAIRYDSCADPGIFVGGGGGGGGEVRSIRHKKALTSFFIIIIFYLIFSPQLILQKSSGYFQRQLSFS